MNWENWFHLKIFHHCEKWPCPSRFIWSTIGISKTWVIWMNRNKKFMTEVGNSGVITKTIYRRDKQPSYLNQLVWHSQTHLFISFSYHWLIPYQFSSVAKSCPTLYNPMDRSTPGLPVYHQLLEFTQTHLHWISDAIQPSHPLSLPFPPTFNLSQHQGLFQWVSFLHQIAKVLEFQLQYQSFQRTPGLISFRMDWLDLFAVQGTLKSPLQHNSSKASILRCSAFFTVQLSHVYNDYWKNHSFD